MDVSTTISAVMTTEVRTITPEATMAIVQELFRTHSIHHLPVVENDQVVGMVSKTDYLMLLHGFTLFNTKESRDFNQVVLTTLTVREVMSKKVATINPEDTLEMAAGIFRENRFHALPVVEKHSKKLVGIITVMDLLNFAFTNPSLVSR